MKTNVNRKVEKEIEKVPDNIKVLVAEFIEELIKAENLHEVKNIIPIESTKELYYRKTVRNYRLLLYYEKDTKTVTVHALTHRKDTYKKENLPWRK